MARSIQDTQFQQPGHMGLQVGRQPLSRCDQSQDQEIVRIKGTQRFLTDPLQELEEILIPGLSVERKPDFMRVRT